MKKAILNIEGMHCASCAGHVERSVSKITGVKNVTVNAVTGKAFVDFEGGITEDQLKKIWIRWQKEKDIKFIERVREEAGGLGKGLISVAKQFYEKRSLAIAKMGSGEDYNFDLDDIMPPLSFDIF